MRIVDGSTEAVAAAPEPAAELSRRDELRLLRDAADGDPDAADRLVHATYRQVFATLLRLAGGDRELAADLTQEAYRKAWSALPTFRGRAKFSTWLHKIAYTTYLDHRRRPHRLEPLDDGTGHGLADRLDDPAPGPDEDAEAHGAARDLRRAVLGLPDDLRFTVGARYWGGLPVREIARLEGITGAAVRKRLKKALALLAEQLPAFDSLETAS